MEGEGAAWEGRLCEEIEREEVDVQVVQKPPPRWQQRLGCIHLASGVESIEVGIVWGEGGSRKPSEGWEMEQRGGREGWYEVMG